MPCWCIEIKKYERDIERLQEAYDINVERNTINESLNEYVNAIKNRESDGYEAKNIEEIKSAVDKLDDDLRTKRDELGEAIRVAKVAAEAKKVQLERYDQVYHEAEAKAAAERAKNAE